MATAEREARLEELFAEGEFAVRMNTLPKFVASMSLKEPLAWNCAPLKGDLAEAVTELKEEPGQDVLIHGSGELVNTLHPRGLIDEYRLTYQAGIAPSDGV